MPAVRGTQQSLNEAGTVGGASQPGSASMQEMPEGKKTKPIKREGRGDPYTTVERSSELTAGVGPPGQHGNMEVDKGSQLHTHATDPGAASTTSTTVAAAASKQESK